MILFLDEPKKVFTSFSLYTNVRQLLKLEPKSSKSIECFHGLRALSAFWVIAGHRIFRHDRMVSRPMKIESIFSQVVIAVFMTNGYAVDIFFLISGVLVAQSCLRSLDA
jgi:peptidoglycan/LPS O-acetylase OafA/YrhL